MSQQHKEYLETQTHKRAVLCGVKSKHQSLSVCSCVLVSSNFLWYVLDLFVDFIYKSRNILCLSPWPSMENKPVISLILALYSCLCVCVLICPPTETFSCVFVNADKTGRCKGQCMWAEWPAPRTKCSNLAERALTEDHLCTDITQGHSNRSDFLSAI